MEGVYTLESIYGLIKQKRVKMPFINFIYDVVFGYRKKEDIIQQLLFTNDIENLLELTPVVTFTTSEGIKVYYSYIDSRFF